MSPTEASLYTYQAKVERIVDGDTVVATLDAGFQMSIRQTLRLLGIDAPEMRDPDGEERRLAYAATVELGRLVAGKTVFVKTHKLDSFGRYLAQLWTQDGVDVNQAMLDGGFAVPFKKLSCSP